MPLKDDFHIYILDDEYAIVHFLKEWLHSEGFKVDSNTDADLAFKAVTLNTPHLLLLDFNLGRGKTALDFLGRLAAENISVPCIIISGETDTLLKSLHQKTAPHTVLDILPKSLSLELARDRILYQIRNYFNIQVGDGRE